MDKKDVIYRTLAVIIFVMLVTATSYVMLNPVSRLVIWGVAISVPILLTLAGYFFVLGTPIKR